MSSGDSPLSINTRVLTNVPPQIITTTKATIWPRSPFDLILVIFPSLFIGAKVHRFYKYLKHIHKKKQTDSRIEGNRYNIYLHIGNEANLHCYFRFNTIRAVLFGLFGSTLTSSVSFFTHESAAKRSFRCR